MRRTRIQSHRAPEFADRVVLHFGVAISAAKKHVEGAGIAHGGHNRVENLRGSFLAFRILERKQRNTKSVGRFEIRLKLDGVLERVDRFAVVALFHPGLALNIESARAVWIEEKSLGSFDQGIIWPIGVETDNGEAYVRLSCILPGERTLVELGGLRKSGFGDANIS